MRLVFIISSLGSGGAERVVVNLANYFCESNEVYIVTFSKEKPFYEIDNRVKLIQLDLLKISKNRFESLINTLKRIWKIKKVSKQIKADINISFMTHTNILAIIASKLNNQKIIVSEDTEYYFYNDKVLFFLRKLIYPFSNYLIVKTLSDKRNYFFLKNVKAISNPLPFKNYIVMGKEKIILAVGRLEKQKGFDTLIDVFSKIKTDWKLYIVGEGSERKNLENLIKKLNLKSKVFLLGNVKEVEKWYSQASIFILPSRKEGFGNVLIEAMAFGCAVISFDCPYGPSEIIENMENGILAENQNKDKLKEAIELLIKNKKLREKLAKEAIKVREKYSIEKIGKEWEKVINEVLSK